MALVEQVEVFEGSTIYVYVTLTRKDPVTGLVTNVVDATDIIVDVYNTNSERIGGGSLTAGTVTQQGDGVYRTQVTVGKPGRYTATARGTAVDGTVVTGRVKWTVSPLI